MASRPAAGAGEQRRESNGRAGRVLVVDLNNFARYPTLVVGYLVAILGAAGYETELLSPLASRLPTLPERRENRWHHLQRRAFFSSHPVAVALHDGAATARKRWVARPNPRLTADAERVIEERRPDIVLLSAYLVYQEAAREVARAAHARGVPVLVGGAAFNRPEVSAEWLDIPGLSAVVGAEVDHTLPAMVDAALTGGDLSSFAGTFLPDGRLGPVARPASLDHMPLPDLRGFPWQLYPSKIIPVMTGRGCSWGHCTFCSDVRVANGLTFRSRPVEAVLAELGEQSVRYGTKDIVFLDIKLNSNLAMWRGIIERFQVCVPGGRWIGTVHVQGRGENGLTRDELRAAADAGLTRMSFGFETGSQRVNNAMAKGTSLERTTQFLEDAHAAGISVRATAIVGYPGETSEDIDETVRFLRAHRQLLDRIRMNLFTPMPGTRFHELYDHDPRRFPGFTDLSWDYSLSRGNYRYAPARERAYRKAKARLLGEVYRINRRPLKRGASVFDGVM